MACSLPHNCDLVRSTSRSVVKLTSGDSHLFFFFLALGESIPEVGVGTESHSGAMNIKQGLRNINSPKSQCWQAAVLLAWLQGLMGPDSCKNCCPLQSCLAACYLKPPGRPQCWPPHASAFPTSFFPLSQQGPDMWGHTQCQLGTHLACPTPLPLSLEHTERLGAPGSADCGHNTSDWFKDWTE